MPAEPAIRCACPNCKAPLVLKNPALAGKEIACPKCKERFVVPDADEEPEDEDRPRKKKKKKEPAQSKTVLYASLGGGGILVLLIAVIVASILFFKGRGQSTVADKDQAKAKKDGGDGKDKKDGPFVPAKGGPGVKLEELPVWTADKDLSADLDPTEQQIGPLRMKIVTQWMEHPASDRRLGPASFGYKFGGCMISCYSPDNGGFGTGQVGPKELLLGRLKLVPNLDFDAASSKIEMGRNGNMAIARCKALHLSPPQVYWSAMVDRYSISMRLEIGATVPVNSHEALIKLFEASLLSAHK